MKRIAAWALLVGWMCGPVMCGSMAAQRENRSIGENSREAKKAAKQYQKYGKKQAKKQRKAAKRAQKAQKRAAKQRHR
jgi:hypothetical protein